MPPIPSTFDIFPALHLAGGRPIDFAPAHPGHGAVRDPLAVARRWIEQGATWIHVINVDAVFDEQAGHDWPSLERLCALGARVQYGGGLHTFEDIGRAMRAGVHRVLLGAAAVESPQTVADAIGEHGRERIALALTTDADGDVLTRGWQSAGGLQALTLGVQMARLGVSVAVHTRLERDGSMTGTDLETSCELAELSGLDIVVGGEVRDMDDVVTCCNRPGITGVLIGKALENGTIDLADALVETRATLAFESGLTRWKAEQLTLRSRLRHALSQRYLAPHLPPADGLRVLDAGGGTGTDSLPLARRGARVDLVDRSRAMLRDFRETAETLGAGERVAEHAIDIREIKRRFPPDAFDVVLAHGVIQYSADWESLLDSMLAPLKRGGLLSLISRNWYAEPYGIDLDAYTAEELPALLERTRGPSRVFDADVLFFSAPYLAGWLDERGLEVVGNHGLLCRQPLPAAEDPDAERGAVRQARGTRVGDGGALAVQGHRTLPPPRRPQALTFGIARQRSISKSKTTSPSRPPSSAATRSAPIARCVSSAR